MKKIDVILNGCGAYDGSEIHEAVLTSLAISHSGAQTVRFVPGKRQVDVISHLTGEAMTGTRNAPIGAARITHGGVRPLAQTDVAKLDALIVSGRLSAAKSLSNFVTFGSKRIVDRELKALTQATYQAGKPLDFMRITPAVLSKAFDLSLRLTIGTDIDIAEVLEEMDAEHVPCPVDDIVVDEDNKIVIIPAYMLAQNITEVVSGIDRLAPRMLVLAE